MIVSGGVVSAVVPTVQRQTAGAGSTTPFQSIARTSKACGPSARPPKRIGDSQALQRPPSRRQSNPAPTSDAKRKSALRSVVDAAGPREMTVSGGTVSTTNSVRSGSGSVTPFLLARTSMT
jgi:hypothetical protein